jgi:hypothetical protein
MRSIGETSGLMMMMPSRLNKVWKIDSFKVKFRGSMPNRSAEKSTILPRKPRSAKATNPGDCIKQ